MTDQPPDTGVPSRRIAKPIEAARTAAIDAAEKTAQAIEGNPMSVLVGGLAIGVLAGAFLPRSDKEGEFLRPIGARLKDGATIVLRAARNAGLAELASAGISRDAARAQVNKLLGAVGQAASRAGDAAAKAAKPEEDGPSKHPQPDAMDGTTPSDRNRA